LHVTISGTRATHESYEGAYYAAFKVSLLPLAMGGAKFHVGGARGIDHLALGYLMELGKASNVTIVVPGRLEQQPHEVKPRLYQAISEGALLIQLQAIDFPSAPAYHARNRWMLNRSEYLAAYPLVGEDRKGGTWTTINEAMRRDMPRTVVPVPGGLAPAMPLSARRK
jgi:predicted Rossmann fold nucleotide-binding protein DprA/Smf involved in DNA uptake